MANPLNLPLSDRIEEIQAEIDELINGRVDELGASAVGVPRDWIKHSLFARNGGLCRCELAIMVLSREEGKTQTAGPSVAIPIESVPSIDDLKHTSPPPFEKLKIDALGRQRMARARALTQRGLR
jgi:hypothetical protein